MPGFHSFTGCDTTSSFFGKGKESAYAVREKMEIDNAFLELSDRDPIKRIFPLLQQFVAVSCCMVSQRKVMSTMLAISF